MYSPFSGLHGWGKRFARKAAIDLFRGSLVFFRQQRGDGIHQLLQIQWFGDVGVHAGGAEGKSAYWAGSSGAK